MNNLISIKEILFVEELSHKQHSSPIWFCWWILPHLKKEITLNLLKVFQKIEEKEHFVTCFIEVRANKIKIVNQYILWT